MFVTLELPEKKATGYSVKTLKNPTIYSPFPNKHEFK